jgi:hypothetical protein
MMTTTTFSPMAWWSAAWLTAVGVEHLRAGFY